MKRLLAVLAALSCSPSPEVTVEKVEVKSPRIPVTINPVIVLPAACDGGSGDASHD